MQGHVGDPGDPLFNQRHAIAVAEKRSIFLHHEQMQPVAALSRLFHQPTMPQGKGIGVHHDGADFFAGLTIHRKLAAIAGQTFAAIFH